MLLGGWIGRALRRALSFYLKLAEDRSGCTDDDAHFRVHCKPGKEGTFI